MNRLALIGLAGMLAAGGCQFQRYRSQSLGQVDYDLAYREGRSVLIQYFSIDSEDPGKGMIVSRPRPVAGKPDRLLAVSPARQIATMRFRRKGDEVFADLRVDVQRQSREAMRKMQPVTVYNELPSRTPAQETAALTVEQVEAWESTGRDADLERTILAELLRKLTPSAPK